MKKNYLMMAMAAAMLASCAQTGLVEEIAEEPQKAIGFSTFVDKATRAADQAENSTATYDQGMNIHHETFDVWGFKNTSSVAVFSKETVTYVAASTGVDGSSIPAHWRYNDLRYWDKAATDYYFYACAPTTAPFTFNGTQGEGKFTIDSEYEVNAINISDQNRETPQTTWKGKSESDLMIAAPCHLNETSLSNAYTGKVGLNFIHILSRLNIVINKYGPSSTSIQVKKITIGNMKYKGTFDEGIGVADNTMGTSSRWNKTDDKIDYSYEINYSVPSNKNNYVIEALIMPQATSLEEVKLDGTGTKSHAYIKIDYSLTSGSITEDFTACYNLAKVFGITSGTLDFNEGWQNTLTITLDPQAIVFTAKTAPWVDKETEELTIE